jgi:hypothetical protein
MPEALHEALRGRVTKHHRLLLHLHLQQIDTLDAAIAEIDRAVDLVVEPFRTEIQLLSSIPGISELSARVILAGIGRDMSRVATAGHLISWAGLCPPNDESAGKRRPSRMRKGAPWLKDHPHPMHLSRGPQEVLLPPGPIPSPARSPWRQECHRRRRRIHAHRRLSHVQGRHPL